MKQTLSPHPKPPMTGHAPSSCYGEQANHPRGSNDAVPRRGAAPDQTSKGRWVMNKCEHARWNVKWASLAFLLGVLGAAPARAQNAQNQLNNSPNRNRAIDPAES